MPDGIDRRQFLTAATAGLATTMASDGRAQAGASQFSLALGGGAARGLAHIPVLEAIDELGVKPSRIAGTSMGALIGACYASGLSAEDIRLYALDLFSNRLKSLLRLFPDRPSNWMSIFSMTNSAVMDAEAFASAVLPANVPAEFSALAIPLQVVTADFYREEEFVIAEGPLRKALGASSALPVFLEPVTWDDRILIDGGFVNPTPFDILLDGMPVVAVDVTGNGYIGNNVVPGALDTWIGSSQIALHSLVNERLKRVRPDLLIRPEVASFSSLDFHRIDEILVNAAPAKEQAKRELALLLDADAK